MTDNAGPRQAGVLAALRRGLVHRMITYPAALVLLLAAFWLVSVRMPGQSFAGALPPLTPSQEQGARRMRADVEMLAATIGPRSVHRFPALDSAASYIDATLRSLGYDVREQTFMSNGRAVRNLEATLPGTTRPDEIVIVGAHYDAAAGTPGADDNASGTAGMLEIARRMRSGHPARTIRFVAFANEEPPFFHSEEMGSRHYARAARDRGDAIVAMLSLETIGYYRDAPGSQRYPFPFGLFYPDRGDFIAIVGNLRSRALVHHAVRRFREAAQFPSAGTAAPGWLPGIFWSDHWSFWKSGYRAIMITDTAPFRNDNYHQESDVPDSLDYDRMARVVEGVTAVVVFLANR